MNYSSIPLVGWFFGWMDENGIEFGGFIAIFGVFLVFTTLHLLGISEGGIFSFLFFTAPIWLPYFCIYMFHEIWMKQIGKKFEIKSGRVVYEIVLPPEVLKSPEAMEFVFTQVWNKATPDNHMETYLDGKRPLPYSFELVSKGGDVRFYAVVPEKFKYGIRDAMYSQYPGVEMRELDLDYTAEVAIDDLDNWAMMSFHMGKKKDSEIPIKTYVEYGLDKMPKEEEKVDPMTPMLEMLSGIKPNQQMWIQFLCKAHRESSFEHGQLKKGVTWDKAVLKKCDEIIGRDSKTKRGEVEYEGMPRITPGERDLLEVMERNVGKTPYEFICRVVYLSNDPKDYDGGLFSRFLRAFAQTEVVGRNGLGMRWRTDFDYKFISDPFGKILPALKKQELKEYKMRVLYEKNSAGQTKIMTAEEMATIFHLPGKVALTPTLNRIQSTRGEAPTNLPIG